jgi:hypothetical protein
VIAAARQRSASRLPRADHGGSAGPARRAGSRRGPRRPRAPLGIPHRYLGRVADAPAAPQEASGPPTCRQPRHALLCPAPPFPGRQRNTRTGHHGRTPDIDEDQLAALRRLRAPFGPIEVVEVVRLDPVVSEDSEDDRGGHRELGEGARMGDPRRMTLRSMARPTRYWSGRSPIPTGKPPARPWTT